MISNPHPLAFANGFANVVCVVMCTFPLQHPHIPLTEYDDSIYIALITELTCVLNKVCACVCVCVCDVVTLACLLIGLALKYF